MNSKSFATLSSHGSLSLVKKSSSDLAYRICCTQLLLSRWGIESAFKSSKSRNFFLQKLIPFKYMQTIKLKQVIKAYRKQQQPFLYIGHLWKKNFHKKNWGNGQWKIYS